MTKPLHPSGFLNMLLTQWPYEAIAACFALSRILAWTLGVRFASSEVETFWQYLDVNLLSRQLWTSILYLHSQPPLMNIFYGILLQVFPMHWPAVAYSLNVLLGLLAYMAIYRIMIENQVPHRLALAVVIVAMCNPSAIVYEAEPFYTHTVFCLLVFAAYLFDSYLKQPAVATGAAFLGILILLVLWRSSYQLAWYVLCAVWLLKVTPARIFRKTLILALIYGAILSGLYAKNEMLFGLFNSSSCSGMSLAKPWAGDPETVRLVHEGMLSPISSILPFSSMDRYLPIVGPLQRTGRESADAIFKHNGSLNLNNIGYPEVSKLYTKDFWRLMKVRPMTIAGKVSRGWLDYFRPASVWISWFDGNNQSAVEGVDRWYRMIFCFGAESAVEFTAAVKDDPSPPMHKLLRRLRSCCWQIAFVYAMIALFLVYLPFQRWVAAKDTLRRQLLLFLALNIAYSAVLSNAVEVAENMRYRFETQGLALIVGTIICYRILRHVFNAASRAKMQYL